MMYSSIDVLETEMTDNADTDLQDLEQSYEDAAELQGVDECKLNTYAIYPWERIFYPNKY